MKHLHRPFFSSWLFGSMYVSVVFVMMTVCSQAQVYTASFSGAAEATPNNSPGTGKAIVTITGTSMNVKATFSGLLGTSTAAHIHAPTTVAGSGTAGVATITPSFTGFPLGVTSGTMNHTFDMTLAGSYNAGYITANGGTPASAFAALKTALNNGTSYFNIHSTVYPGGEIRGFLSPCPAIAVSFPDAFALPQGTAANTVYPAYAPASSITLTTAVSGGATPYSYLWSNGSTNSWITVSPATNTSYSVTVTDNNGCMGSGSTTVSVMYIAGGKNGDKINVCHKNNKTTTIDGTSVADHLAHGDMLGNCAAAPAVNITVRKKETIDVLDAFSVKVIQNPAPNYFDLQINGRAGKNVSVRVYDLMGRAIENRPVVPVNSMLRIGTSYLPGTYMVELVQGTEKQTLKLIKWQ